MKRTILLAAPTAMLITALILGGPAIGSAQAHPSTFSDVSETNPAHEAIEALAAQGAIAGDSDGNFLPYVSLSRGDAARTLVMWRGAEPVSATSRFSDVDGTYGPYVESALTSGWINGYPDGTFRPGQPLTRQQMIMMVVRSLGLETRANGLSEAQIAATLGSFADDSLISDSARPYVAVAVQMKLVAGDRGYLHPLDSVTRAQFCLVLYRAQSTGQQDVEDDLSTDAPVTDSQSWTAAGLSPQEQALADFMTTYLFRPHDSPVTGEMVLQNQHWYGVPALSQLVIMAAETSLGDPNLGGSLARNYNFGCLRYHGAGTAWGLLSSGRIWVAGKDWYSFPDAATGMAAFGRYLKTGVNGFYLPILNSADPSWEKFAAVYYGRSVSGFGSYVSRLHAIENRFRAMATERGVSF
jgi:hypothetical protein